MNTSPLSRRATAFDWLRALYRQDALNRLSDCYGLSVGFLAGLITIIFGLAPAHAFIIAAVDEPLKDHWVYLRDAAAVLWAALFFAALLGVYPAAVMLAAVLLLPRGTSRRRVAALVATIRLIPVAWVYGLFFGVATYAADSFGINSGPKLAWTLHPVWSWLGGRTGGMACLGLLFATMFYAGLRTPKQRTPKELACRGCGYCLVGLAAPIVCPECGEEHGTDNRMPTSP